MFTHLHIKTLAQQKGVSSLIVMMILILTLISVLSAQRVGLLNEAFMGADSDTQRAFAATEAILQDAKLDIQGYKTNDDGTTTACTDDGLGCRAAGDISFPQGGNAGAYSASNIELALNGASCKNGICLPFSGSGLGFWLSSSTLANMKAVAAKYGQYTGADSADNSVLANKSWYWVEVYTYNTGGEIAQSGLPSAVKPPMVNPINPYVYRITAITEGQKTGTISVLQTYYVPSKNAGTS